jgi:tetratricopeptide (TPR) repeat protein
MIRIASVLVTLAIAASVSAGSPPPTPTPLPPRTPNPLAEPFKANAETVDKQIAGTPEWLRVYAGAVVSDWATVRTDGLKLTEKFPRSADAQIALAVGLEGTGDHDGAVTALRKAVELDPRHLGGWLMLAQMNFRLNRLQDAALALEQARKLAPGNIGLLMDLAKAYARLGDAERASRVLAGVTKAAPDNVEAWINYLVMASRTTLSESAWREYGQLKVARPEVAAAVAKELPAEVAATMPKPVPPAAQPTPTS